MEGVSAYPDGDLLSQEVGRTDNVRPAVIERALRSLGEDAERCEGLLARATVDRLYAKRQLTVLECIEVEKGLRARNIEVEEEADDADEPAEDSSLGVSSAPRQPITFLTEQEERDCGRALSLASRLSLADEMRDPTFCARVRKDAERAREKLICSNMRWVAKVAKQYRSTKHLEPEDLRQEGVMGLMRATELYDPDLGFRFKTYATWWIRQRIQRAIGDMDRTIRLPIHVQEQLRKVRRAEQTLLAENGVPPSAARVADYLGVERERFLHFLWRLNSSNVAELDAPVSEETSLADLRIDEGARSPFDDLANGQLTQKLNQALSSLKPREERVIRMRFGLGSDMDHTLEEIGQQFDLTRERIRQIEAKALLKLRHRDRARPLEHFRFE